MTLVLTSAITKIRISEHQKSANHFTVLKAKSLVTKAAYVIGPILFLGILALIKIPA